MMTNFRKVADGLNVGPLLAGIEANPQLWEEITIRQDYPGSAHHSTKCIFLRGPEAFTAEAYQGTVTAFDYPAMQHLGNASLEFMPQLLKGFADVGYVLIVNLPAGASIDEHIDEGGYAEYYKRFHVALTGEPGAVLTVNGQDQHFAPGECWWFDHRSPHSARNEGSTDRIHLIFDAA